MNEFRYDRNGRAPEALLLRGLDDARLQAFHQWKTGPTPFVLQLGDRYFDGTVEDFVRKFHDEFVDDTISYTSYTADQFAVVRNVLEARFPAQVLKALINDVNELPHHPSKLPTDLQSIHQRWIFDANAFCGYCTNKGKEKIMVEMIPALVGAILYAQSKPRELDLDTFVEMVVTSNYQVSMFGVNLFLGMFESRSPTRHATPSVPAQEDPSLLKEIVGFADKALDRQHNSSIAAANERTEQNRNHRDILIAQGQQASQASQQQHQQFMAVVTRPPHNRRQSDGPMAAANASLTHFDVATGQQPGQFAGIGTESRQNEVPSSPPNLSGRNRVAELEAEVQHLGDIASAKKREARNERLLREWQESETRNVQGQLDEARNARHSLEEVLSKNLEKIQKKMAETQSVIRHFQETLERTVASGTPCPLFVAILEFIEYIGQTSADDLAECEFILALQPRVEIARELIHNVAKYLPQLNHTVSIVEKFLELDKTPEDYEKSLGLLARTARVIGVENFEQGAVGVYASTFMKLKGFKDFVTGNTEDFAFVKRFAQLLHLISQLNSFLGVHEKEDGAGEIRTFVYNLLLNLVRHSNDYGFDTEEEQYLNLFDCACQDASVLVRSEPFKAFAKGDEMENEALHSLIQQVINNLFTTDDEEICDGEAAHGQDDE